MAEKKTLPGPEGRPLFGSFFDVDMNKAPHVFTAWSLTYGPIYEFRYLGRKAVVLTSADLMREAFETNGRAVAGRPSSTAGKEVTGNNDVAFSDKHEDNPALRKLLSTCLNSLETRMQEGMQDSMVTLRKRLSDITGQTVDIGKSTQFAHINFTTNLIIGEILKEDDPDHVAFLTFIEGVHQLFKADVSLKLSLFPFLKHVPWSSAGQVLRDIIEARNRLTRKYFTEQKATWKEGKTRGLVDVFLQRQHEDTSENRQKFPSDKQVQSMILGMVAAGTGQQIKALRGLFLMMCDNVEEQKLIQKEIDEQIGPKELPSVDKRNDMPYTQAAIFESLRYTSQSPLAIPHVCIQDTTVGGYHLPKGTTVIPNLWGVHHSEAIWGDPWVFRPGRFLDDSGNLLPRDSDVMKNLLPFSVGTRDCVGDQIALKYIFLCFTSTLQKFSILPADDMVFPSTDPRLYSRLYPYDEPDFKCKVVPRE